MDGTPARPRYALVARVPRSVEVRIEDLYLNLLGTSRPIMGFHITLLGPYFWTGAPSEAILNEAAALCQRWPSFEIQIGGLDAFYDGDNSAVYIRILNPEPLRALHSALHALFRPSIVLQREFPPAGYLPHITLGLGLSAAERDRILSEGADAYLSAVMEVNELHLVEERPNAPWRSVRVFPFEGQRIRQPHEAI